MQDDRLKYGADFTSVRVQQSPGGNSSLSLAWEDPGKRKPVRREEMQDYAGRGQSWDGRQVQNPMRNPGRAYPEPRQPPAPIEPRPNPPVAGGYRAYQDPEPAFRGDLPWRDEAGSRYQADEQRRRQVDDRDPRFAPRTLVQRSHEMPPDNRVYVPRQRQADPAYEERVYIPRPRPAEANFEERVYVPQRARPADPTYTPYLVGSGPIESDQVHTSVKVRQPPGGRTNFTFG